MGDISANFDRSEFACSCGCGFDTVDTELLTMLEVIRQHFDAKIKVTSGCRCVARNSDPLVGGSKRSKHLIGRAADIQVEGISPEEVANFVDKTWPDSYGLGRYRTFTHVDSRGGKARWGG